MFHSDPTTENKGAAEEKENAFGWIDKLRYEKSFAAKLALSDNFVKNAYAVLTTDLLSYEKVKTSVHWSGVTFSVGRIRAASIAFSGKTLCLYLALSPGEFADGKYKVTDASSVRKREKTPALLKIRSDGALRHAEKLIAALAAALELKPRAVLSEPVTAKSFPADSFGNLLARGLIRLVRTGKRGEPQTEPAETSQALLQTSAFQETEIESEPFPKEDFSDDIYGDTVKTSEGLLSRYRLFGEILEHMAQGAATAKLSKKVLLRSIDEIWVNAVEEVLPALDTLIRRPTGFIAETEEVLPIELTKKITGRSVQHLARHSDYISTTDDGELMPTKILNVFREDSLLTYENKFLNTLLDRLYVFVDRRYRVGKDFGADETSTELTFSDVFLHGDYTCKVGLNVEISKKIDENTEAPHAIPDSPLFRRVEKLHGIVSAYKQSDFAKKMGTAYIHPPVMRTNAILKNKYFRQCLALWEFIESYDDAGYGITVEEHAENLTEGHLRRIYGGLAVQYLVFRHDVTGDFDEEKTLASYLFPTIDPRIVTDKSELSRESFDRSFKDADSAEEEDILFAMEVALLADETWEKRAEEEERQKALEKAAEEEREEEFPEEDLAEEDEEAEIAAETVGEAGFGFAAYRRTFLANLSLSSEETKARFVALGNHLLGYRGVKYRISKRFCTFNRGRDRLLQVEVRGNVLKLYFALEAATADPKYHLRDVSAVRSHEKTPAQFREKSRRGEVYAADLVRLLAEKFGLKARKTPGEELSVLDYPYRTVEELVALGLITPVAARNAPANPEISAALSEEIRTLAGEKQTSVSSPARESGAAAADRIPTGVLAPEVEALRAPVDKTREEAYDSSSSAPLSAAESTAGKEEMQKAGEETVKAIALERAEKQREEQKQKRLAEEEQRAKEEDFPEIVFRVDADYTNPENAGLDDTSGFLTFEKEIAAGGMNAARKKEDDEVHDFIRTVFSKRTKKNRKK